MWGLGAAYFRRLPGVFFGLAVFSNTPAVPKSYFLGHLRIRSLADGTFRDLNTTLLIHCLFCKHDDSGTSRSARSILGLLYSYASQRQDLVSYSIIQR